VRVVRKLSLIFAVLALVGCGKSADDYMREGNAYLRKGDMANAISQFEMAVEADSDNHEARNALGAALSATGDFERAIGHFRAAIAANDEFVEGHYNLGRALAELGSFDEALDEFRAVLRLDSTYTLAYFSAGDVFAAKGLAEQAVDSYTRAIRIDPNLMAAYMRLASIYVGMGEYDQGIDLLLRARALRPNDPEIISMAGRAAIRKRDFTQAVGLFEDAVELDSLNLLYRNDLATALMLGDRKDDAVEQWQWILDQNPDAGLEQVVRQNLDRALSE
jgi:Flp pilus assembly protein TadD